MKNSRLNRRSFLRRTVWVAAAAASWPAIGQPARSANDRLNLGIIGVANRGGDNLGGVAHENIAALCDVNEAYLEKAAQRFPKAKLYHDFRKMLEQRDLDAVVVSTADHTHAPATLAALHSGRDVYCEKPLTHTVSEARLVAQATRAGKRVTQMGTQIHAGKNYRRVVELIKSGAIGPVAEAHNWADSVWAGRRVQPVPPPPPANFHWDLWLGPAPPRPFDPAYVPAAWRGWWQFGGGAMADMACHHMDLSFWALDLRHPETVEAHGPPLKAETAPEWLIVEYQFPARGAQPPLRLTWYNGGKRPRYFEEGVLPKWGGGGTLFVGSKGMLLADYDRHILLPEKDFVDFQRPAAFIPDSVGHHQEWLNACRTRGPTTCNFQYGGMLTESVLLGNVSYRLGKKLTWDAARLQVDHCPEAALFVRHHYRQGWNT